VRSDSDDSLAWKLRLFLSADLVGSTAYKASQSRGSPEEGLPQEWASTFKEFFHEFPSAIEANYAQLPKGCVPCKLRIKPWKFLGDEILFWVQLASHKEAASHLWAFKKAVHEFPRLWSRKTAPLNLKGTAWLAGFPVTNTEIIIPLGKNRETVDFIGPSIDLGFRIAEYSDTRRFVISADLALMLLDAIHSCEIDIDLIPLKLYLHGRELLKGVLSSEPYPVLWIDMLDGRPDLEEELLGTTRLHKPDRLHKFLREFIDHHSPQLLRPFIADDPDPKYGTIPEAYKRLREGMLAEESTRGYLTDKERNPPRGGKPKRIPEPMVPPPQSPKAKRGGRKI
jgi:hypothetical protein